MLIGRDWVCTWELTDIRETFDPKEGGGVAGEDVEHIHAIEQGHHRNCQSVRIAVRGVKR